MAKVLLQGTEFTFSILPLKFLATGVWARTEISVRNEYVSYQEIGANILRDEVEEWIFCMYRLLAGGYANEYALSFERAGIAVDFYPYGAGNKEVSREERRRNDCKMAIRMLMRSKDKRRFWGGVYTVLLNRAQIKEFADALRLEFDAVFAKYANKRGKILFVGVSPKDCKGCNYWYIDDTKTVQKGDYVWVRMGRRDTEQIVYVDSVRFCNDDETPYDLESARHVLRKADESEVEKW